MRKCKLLMIGSTPTRKVLVETRDQRLQRPETRHVYIHACMYDYKWKRFFSCEKYFFFSPHLFLRVRGVRVKGEGEGEGE
jgi:hypothetical protein